MPTLHACPLSRLHETVAAVRAGHVASLVNVAMPIERPVGITPERHLVLRMSDIVVPMEGHALPDSDHIERFLDFVAGWDQAAPLVIHCWAGISRSTAGVFIAACALNPRLDEEALAGALRAASPSATPNARLVALADSHLGRGGRMSAAIARIGRGADAFEGAPFALAWR